MVNREDGRQLHDDLATQHRSGTSKRQLIRGEGSAARISNELQPPDPGCGVRLVASRAKLLAPPMDTWHGSSGEEHVCFPLPQVIVEQPVPRPTAV